LRALERLGAQLGMEVEEGALGVFRIINSQMADLIRKSTIEQGHDPRDCVLVAYGGAGPTHAAFYGHEIGAKAILVLADSTVFSAEGMLTCDITHTAETSRLVDTPLSDEDLTAIGERFEKLEARVREQFLREGAREHEISLARTLGVRFRQQVTTLEVEADPGPVTPEYGQHVLERFFERYAQVYGQGALLAGGGCEIELHRVVGRRPIQPVDFPEHELGGEDPSPALRSTRSVYFEPVGFTETRIYDGHALAAGNVLEGPAIVERMGDSAVIPPGYRAAVDRYLTMQLSNASATAGAALGSERLEVTR